MEPGLAHPREVVVEYIQWDGTYGDCASINKWVWERTGKRAFMAPRDRGHYMEVYVGLVATKFLHPMGYLVWRGGVSDLQILTEAQFQNEYVIAATDLPKPRRDNND
jgi:hypothetical protein